VTADWLASDEGHRWIDSTFEYTHLYTEGFYQIKDDTDADPASWPNPSEGDHIDDYDDDVLEELA